MTATTKLFVNEGRSPRRFSVTPLVELSVLLAAAVIAAVSYLLITDQAAPQRALAPPLIAFLLIANLVPGVALMILFGRRIAKRRAALSAVGGEGRLHVRLVAIFSLLAAVPMLLLTIFASLLFQYGVQFWYSDRARGLFENANALANASYAQMLDRWDRETVTMAVDLSAALTETTIDSPEFIEYFGRQTYTRNLSEAAIYSVTSKNGVQTIALVNPYQRDLSKLLNARTVRVLRGGRTSVVQDTGDRVETLTRLPQTSDLFLYGGRINDSDQMSAQSMRARAVLSDYRSLLSRSRSLQLRFNAALLIISLLIVGLAVWIALTVADRLVRPVGELVDAAERVAGGDLRVRVTTPRASDEIGTLATAFNAMTARLEEQNTALVTANAQLDSRRALIEAVMSGVSAGVVSIADDGEIRLINSSAQLLLGLTDNPIGKPLASVSGELADLVESNAREAIVHIVADGVARTLAVRIARDGAGPILTFDDITQQLLDQRRAAWSDVARRIAHEIKNPLTPIQLAAERLQRRYGKKVDADDTTFGRLTDTIIRQVADLRRMVDEFSSFARMPKPVFRPELLVDIARQSMFLHEVAHSGVRFEINHDDPGPTLVCDRRQIGQALTNLVKNSVEAIQAREGDVGSVMMTIAETASEVSLWIEDDGVGLPAERDRIVEPYMTTRARGTGLGLAIVKKIVEEHAGNIAFSDRAGVGTRVTLTFDREALAHLDSGRDATEPSEPTRFTILPRGGG